MFTKLKTTYTSKLKGINSVNKRFFFKLINLATRKAIFQILNSADVTKVCLPNSQRTYNQKFNKGHTSVNFFTIFLDLNQRVTESHV